MREINPEPESKIFEVRQYADDHGRRVQEFVPVRVSTVEGVVPFVLASDVAFIRGQAQIMSHTPQGPRQMQFDFQFPAKVATIGQAFACFDEVVKAALAELQRQQQKAGKDDPASKEPL